MGSGSVVLFGSGSGVSSGPLDSRVGADLRVRPEKDHGVRYGGAFSMTSGGPCLTIFDQCKGQVRSTG